MLPPATRRRRLRWRPEPMKGTGLGAGRSGRELVTNELADSCHDDRSADLRVGRRGARVQRLHRHGREGCGCRRTCRAALRRRLFGRLSTSPE